MIRGAGGRLKQLGGQMSSRTPGTDSLQRRNKNEDSITIRFRYLDSTRVFMLDSSIADYTRRFPIPATNIFLGNTGSASRSLLFSPWMQAGWDPGFHAFDIYKWTTDKVRFFNTTRPYSELNYQLASRSEQIIEIVHTQNIKPNWNFLLQYRLINSPGTFKNQKTNHNNYLLTTWYQSLNKRYNLYGIVLANRLQAGENGGIQDTTDFLNDPDFTDRFNISTKLGGDPDFRRSIFSTDVGTGNRYTEINFLLRQQYDFGRKDSLVTDSTVIPLFYPRLRFEHTLRYNTLTYNFRDYVADSSYYQDYYAQTLRFPVDSFEVQDKWRELVNDFSIYQFPDANNLHQFIKAGATLQNMTLDNRKANSKLYNISGHLEYRNRSKNQKWDIEANGRIYFAGFNAGDYHAYASLQRFVGKRKGYALIGFENVNRTPDFIYDSRSEFNFLTANPGFKKENTAHAFASLYQPALKLKLSGDYYVVTNYSYLRGFYELSQESTLFNLLRISAHKTFRIGRWWNWHSEVYFQQKLGDAPVNVPLVYTRNRIGYEGNLGFKNLDIAFGAEFRYHTPYEADNYSPILGKFSYQDTTEIRNRPDIAAYVHFRIKSFKLYFRAENLNTAEFNDGFGFTRNNLAATGYPYPGMILRFGIYWAFVN